MARGERFTHQKTTREQLAHALSCPPVVVWMVTKGYPLVTLADGYRNLCLFAVVSVRRAR